MQGDLLEEVTSLVGGISLTDLVTGTTHTHTHTGLNRGSCAASGWGSFIMVAVFGFFLFFKPSDSHVEQTEQSEPLVQTSPPDAVCEDGGADASGLTGRCWPVDLLRILSVPRQTCRAFLSADEGQLTPSPDLSLTLDGSFPDSLQRPEE